MLIRGSSDYVVPKKAFLKTALKLGTEPIEFESMGHDIMLESKGLEVMRAIDAWLTEVVK